MTALASATDDVRFDLVELDAARERLDRATELLQWSLDLREQLQWGLDLDEMTAEGAAFKCACHAWRAA